MILPDLTHREQEVAALLAEDESNKEIASELRISIRTVRFHVSNLLEKFQVSTRMEFAAVWRRQQDGCYQ
ncbi:MAG: helix-turn-helix transcriptional regulator [Acidobacteria bacterium]|nr:helix-turn-helix transcriptional regulator [Acidobacteriota bacterium]